MSGVFAALLYLRTVTFRNSLVSRFRRLRRPKYLLGGIVGVAYFYFAIFARLHINHGNTRMPQGSAQGLQDLPVIANVGALFMTMFVALCWTLGRERASLVFSEAEIALLFPAPVKRSVLVNYRLISAQLGTLFTALVFSIVSSGWSVLHGGVAVRVVGWWLVFSTLALHFTASSFTITRLQERGVAPLRRRLMSVGIVVLVLLLPAGWIWRHMQLAAAQVADLPALVGRFTAMLATPPLAWLLQPAKWLLAPMLAVDAGSFLRAIGPALLIFAVHYYWVLRSEVSFEEASLARAEKRARQMAAARAGKLRYTRTAPKARPPPFALGASGRVEIAFLWKNLLSCAAFLRPRTAVIAAACVIGGSLWLGSSPRGEALGNLVVAPVAIIAGYWFLFGPQLVRQDLRRDLEAIDILKTYPLHGWQIVAGELLTPVIIVTSVFWLLLLAAALIFRPEDAPWLTPAVRGAVALTLGLVALLVCAVQLLVMNAAAVLFPAWVATGHTRAAGIEVMGQRMLFIAGQFIVVALALVPAAMAAALFFLTLRPLTGMSLAGLVAAVSALTVLGTEVGLGVLWLGHRFERFDASTELGP